MTTQVTDQLAALQLEKTEPIANGTIKIAGRDMAVNTLNTWLKLSIMREKQPFRRLPIAYFPCRSVHHFPPCFEYGFGLRDEAEIYAFATCLKIPTEGVTGASLILTIRNALTKRLSSTENWPCYSSVNINYMAARKDCYVLYVLTNYSGLRDVTTVTNLLPSVVREMGCRQAAWYFSADNEGKILECEDWTIELGAKQRQPHICCALDCQL